MAIACTAALAQIRGALPEDEGGELSVPVRFWWWQPHVAQEMARMMPAPRWELRRASLPWNTAVWPGGLPLRCGWCGLAT